MATEYLYLRGKAKWAKLFKPDQEYDNFTIQVYLDDESNAIFKDSGLQLEPKTDDDGEYVTFRRPNYKQIKNELVHFGAPRVIGKDGEPMTQSVGNGSQVVVKVVVYDSKKGKGHRLEAVQVEDLVVFEGSGGEASVKSVEGVTAF